MDEMPPLWAYFAIAGVADVALGALIFRDYRRLQAAESAEDKRPHRTRVRRWLGLMGLILALYPVMYGKGIFNARKELSEYLELVIGFSGLAIILGGVMFFSEPEPPPSPGDVDAQYGNENKTE